MSTDRRAEWDARFHLRHPGHTIGHDPSGRRRCLDCTRRTDPAAVQRAIDGNPPADLTPAERAAAVTRLRARGMTGTAIADRIHATDRTVWRVLARARQNQETAA
ncbi:helix-turn-helix domain-containing protein [Streptomyces xiamenensis]|uniref:helix-turn-helix domain-containing protein n=1 Tax=Streptomyces xiamenensis TaxID=408015 RepID=UPI0037D139D5